MNAVVFHGSHVEPRTGLTSRSSVQIVSGKKDHLLRQLRLTVDMSIPPDLRAKVGGNAGLRASFSMDLAGPNRPVRVSAPAGARRLQ